jgi:hypothetical protein
MHIDQIQMYPPFIDWVKNMSMHIPWMQATLMMWTRCYYVVDFVK